MGFFQTMGRGYKLMYEDAKLKWHQYGPEILTGIGTSLMLVANGLFAKKASKEDVRKAIAEANAVINEIKNAPVISEETGATKKEVTKAKAAKQYKLAKARGKKFVTIGKKYWKEALVSAVGAGCVCAGARMNYIQKTEMATALTIMAAELKGATLKKGPDGKLIEEQNDISENETGSEDGGVVIQKDPNAFKFWFSPETCPSLYSDNLEITKSNLMWVERTLEHNAWSNGHLYLNDMRREFGGLKPNTMDHPLGGIFGKMFKAYKADDGHWKMPHFELGGWRDDVDFMEGRKVGTWIIFPCDPEPIANKVNRKIIAVEDPVH